MTRFGKCHICGLSTKLSFEHVPPRAAFNDRQVLYKEVMKLINHFPEEIKGGRISQKGMGGYTLCPKCNNNTGKWYGSAFADFAYQGMSILNNTDNKPTLFHNFFIYPLRVLKQILCMFFSANGSNFQEKNLELVRFVLNKDAKYLNPKIKIYAFYNISKHIRSTGVVSLMNLSGDFKMFSEITFPPFGYVMDFENRTPDKRLVDISYFAKYDYNTWTSMFLKFPLLPVYSFVPGDYRTEEEIKKTIEENKKLKYT